MELHNIDVTAADNVNGQCQRDKGSCKRPTLQDHHSIEVGELSFVNPSGHYSSRAMFTHFAIVLYFAAFVTALDLNAAVPYSLAPGYGAADSQPNPVALYNTPDAAANNKAPPKTLTRTVYRVPAASAVVSNPNQTKSNATSTSLGSCKNVQSPNVKADQERADVIKEAFMHGWNAYSKYADGFDELRPLSLNGIDNRYGWGLTIIDSLSTAIIMGLTDIVGQMLEFVGEVGFSRTDFPDENGGVELFGRHVLGWQSQQVLMVSQKRIFAISEG